MGKISSLEVIIGSSVELISKAQIIRRRVFVEEQKIPEELDLDGFDKSAIHALVYDGKLFVATARLLPLNSRHAVMARVAVLHEFRGLGIATQLVKALMLHAQEQGFSSIELHAHQYLRNYYENFGFEFIKNVEVVGEHQLIEMRYQQAHT